MACPVTCQRRSASTIMSGMAIPMTANTMWKARDTPICERAARRSDMKGKISGEVREVRGGWWRFVSCITFLLTTDTRGDGDHAVLQGLLPERLLRRAEPEAAEAGPGRARGLRPGRSGNPRDQHFRREP